MIFGIDVDGPYIDYGKWEDTTYKKIRCGGRFFPFSLTSYIDDRPKEIIRLQLHPVLFIGYLCYNLSILFIIL